MSRALVVLRCLILTTVTGSAALLSPPSAVRLSSYNMDLVLRWDPPGGAAADLTYTAEYRWDSSREQPWRSACTNTSARECVLSSPNATISVFGIYTGRVRSHRGAEPSEWAESNKLTMDRDTVIGPPAVSLVSNGHVIEVSVTDPEFVLSSLRTVYGTPTYSITYWRDGHKDQAEVLDGLLQNPVVLEDLDPWTRYCVQVKIHTETNLNPSRLSETACESTAGKEKAPWVAAVVVFIVMAMVMALIVVSVMYRKKIKLLLCPKISVPSYFQNLQAPLSSSMHHTKMESTAPEEVCDPVTVIPHGSMEEEECPLQADGEECPLQADCEGCPLQADGEECSLQADSEECPLQAALSSCSSDCDVMEAGRTER